MKSVSGLALVVSVSLAQALSTASLTAAQSTVTSSWLFSYESLQLTEGALSDVSEALQNQTVADMFDFAITTNSSTTVVKRSTQHH
ncbi:CAZyme family AA7 [Penicillium lividum]|nr:CAZyme family AA7 [Penicillium lividum]